jgi:hypothetical protein
MKLLLSLSFALVSVTTLFSQNTSFVTIKAGSNFMDVLTIADVFHYPQFTYGKVFFRDGTVAEVKMNYNKVLDEMHFIGPKGDTLALANEGTVKFIAIGEDSFYYDQGYVRNILGASIVKLAVKQVWKVVGNNKRGAYNSASSSSAISSKSSYSNGRGLYKLNVDEDMVLSKVELYYFGDKYNHFVLAGKKNLLMLFPKEQQRIGMFLTENKVDFSNRDDLEKTVRFLEQL